MSNQFHGFAFFPNRHYECCICKKQLGTRKDRLLGRKTKNVTTFKGKEYCDKHYIQASCKHQHTVIDTVALRAGKERFLKCFDCKKGY